MKVAATIERVLAGDAPVTLIQAMTPQGHQIKIEVPKKSIDGRAGPGDILLIEWVVFENPNKTVSE